MQESELGTPAPPPYLPPPALPPAFPQLRAPSCKEDPGQEGGWRDLSAIHEST